MISETENRIDGTGRRASAAGKVRETASVARSRASAAYGTARESAARTGRRTAEEIETNPVGALIGGLALGALAAALLPGTRREVQAFGKVGRRINETAREAARAAREAGAGKLDELGINPDAAKRKLNEIAGNAGEAVRTSADAAAEALKGSRQG